MSEANKQAWGDFWARQRGHDSGGCLPDGYRGIEAAQKAAWQTLASSVRESARVLDLATGDGRVMRWLLEEAPTLALTGVDLAPQLPPAPQGTTMLGGVAMEHLPFGEAAFDVVVSQFGFEYGDIGRVAKEARRVLVEGGLLAILTHRIDGPILAHNRSRRMQIGWVFERRNLFRKAKTALEAGARAPSFEMTQAVQEGAQRFGAQSAAWEIAEAVRRTVAMRAQAPLAQVIATLDAIAAQAKNEVARIDSLAAACRTTQDSAAFDRSVGDAGFDLSGVEALTEAGSLTPFADFRRYRRV